MGLRIPALEDVRGKTLFCQATPHSDTELVGVGEPSTRAAAWELLGQDAGLRSTDYDMRAAAEAMRATGFPRTDFSDELLRPWSRERVLGLIAELSAT